MKAPLKRARNRDRQIKTAKSDVNRLLYEGFDEFYYQVINKDFPKELSREPLVKANGKWRYNLRINGAVTFNERGYAEVSVHDRNDPPVSVILHPALISEDGMRFAVSDEEVDYEPFAGGRIEKNQMKLEGNNCVMYLKQFYAFEGKEYLLANLLLPNKQKATVMMIRGKE
jgi:hypothetical protein